MKTPLIISLILIAVYLVWYIWRYKTPPSFSETYSKLKQKQKWIFPGLLWLFSISVVLADHRLLFGISAGLLALVGLARKYWLKSQHTAHIIGAIGSVAFGLAGLWVYYGAWYYAPAFVVIYISLENVIRKKSLIHVRNHTLITELSGFIMLAVGLLLA